MGGGGGGEWSWCCAGFTPFPQPPNTKHHPSFLGTRTAKVALLSLVSRHTVSHTVSHHHHQRYHFRILTIRKPLQLRIPSWLLSPHGCLGRGARRAPGIPASQLIFPSLPGLSSMVTWRSMDPRTDREKTGHHALRFPKVSDLQTNRNLKLGLASGEICRGSLQTCSSEKWNPARSRRAERG